MIPRELIENRINNFLGYGNINSDIWFVCMEEGFGGTQEDLKLRLNVTKDKTVIDIQNDMMDVPDHMRYFVDGHPPIQRTWSKMIIMLLTFDSEGVSTEDIRKYQRTKLGRLIGNHCILDFMPLPSCSTNEEDWSYKDFGIDYLENRSIYLQEIMPIRVKLFQKHIKEQRPKNVIFCSRTYLPRWSEIAGCEFKEMDNLYFCRRSGINYFVTPHPTAHGLSSADWVKMAVEIKILSEKKMDQVHFS